MIDNQFSNLDRMIRARVVGFGLLTPKIICDHAGSVRSFDLQRVLDMAVSLAGGASSPPMVHGLSVVAASGLCDQHDFGWQSIAGSPSLVSPNLLADGPAIFTVPLMNETWMESDLHTGRILPPSPLDPVTVLRALKRQVRKVLT